MGKEAFVPQYRGKTMEMVKLRSIEDYETLPLTKWNIKQPSTTECRENALETGKFYDKQNYNKKTIYFMIRLYKIHCVIILMYKNFLSRWVRFNNFTRCCFYGEW